jgi:hypothetical protein
MTHEDMTLAELAALTDLIDTYNYDKEEMITPIGLHASWWPRLNQLRQAPNKADLLESWKYKKELESAEYSYTNNSNKHVNVDDWEQRFVVDFWLCIYH